MSYNFDSKIVEEIRNAPQNSIEEVVGEHLKLDRKGKNFVGICPFHDDHKPSMVVTAEIGRFKCFVCGAGGDIFTFLQMREGITFPEAVKRLADRAGITLKRSVKKKSENPNSSPAALLYKANQWALNYWQAVFSRHEAGQKARDYVGEREINAESVEKWSLGYAPDDWRLFTDAALNAGLSENLLVEAGFSKRREESGGLYDAYRDRLIFPIRDSAGRVIGFGGRTLGGDNAKYINSPTTPIYDKSRCVYGIENARYSIVQKGFAVLVEGYTDVIMAHQFGFDNVVAALGTSFTSGHAKLLRRYARELVIMLDGDVAGIKAAERALEVCIQENVEVKICEIPNKQDPCEFLLSEGAEKLSVLIDNATEAMSWKWDRMRGQFEQATIPEKKQLVETYLSFIADAVDSGAVDPMTRGLIINRVSSLINLPAEDVNRMISRHKGTRKGITKENRTFMNIDIGTDYLSVAQREVLEVLFCRPELMEKIELRIALDFFTVPVLRSLAEKTFDMIHSADGFNETILASELDPTERLLLNRMIDSGIAKGNFEERIMQAVDLLASEYIVETKTQETDGLEDYLENIKKKQVDNRYKNLRNGLF